MQAEDNDLEARQLETEWRSRVSTMLYGGESGPGYFSAKSNDAIAGFGPTRQQLEDLRSEIEGRASNDAVRSVFADVSTSQMLANLDSMASHLGTERITAQIETLDARRLQYINDAAADYGNPEVFNAASAVIVNETMREGDLEGWSDEVTQAAIVAQYDVLGKSVVQAAMVNDPDAALAIFNDVKALMSGTGRADLAKTLDDVTLAHRAQEAAATILSMGLSYTEQLAYARDFYDGKLEDAVLADITGRYNEDRTVIEDARSDKWETRREVAFEREEEDRLLDEQAAEMARDIGDLPEDQQSAAVDAVVNTQLRDKLIRLLEIENTLNTRAEAAAMNSAYESASTATTNGTPLDDWIAANPDQWRVLSTDAQTVAALRSYERARVEGPRTDWAVYGELMSLTDEEIRTGGVPMLARARANMTDVEFSQFRERFDSAVDPAGQETGVSREDAHALLRSRAFDLGIELNSDDGGKFASAFILRLDALREEGPVTLPMVNQLIDDLTREVVTQGPSLSIFGRAPYFFRSTQGPAYTVPVLPSDKSDLVDGKSYTLSDGSIAVWFEDEQGLRRVAP